MKNQNQENNFYITTTLPYVNAEPHIGFALEIIRADAIARFKRLQGFDVFFNTGTDEHGTKIHQKSLEEKMDTQEFVNQKSEKFKDLKEILNISFDKFIRTTDADHISAAQEFWKICDDNGYIYKKKYSGLYCVGCEMFLPEKDLVNGECPHHPGKKLELLEEENYFFKYSAFQDKLMEYYNNNPDFVIPEKRFNEIKSFVESGLEDFSISRLKEKMPWGVPVPGDDEQVMYVWFDALVNYISTLDWPNTTGNFDKFWTNGIRFQICGKDNLQHQTARWQAMLMAAGLPNSHHVLVNGFINSNGQKMSKTIGNVINPLDLVNEYGTDALRYYLLREMSSFEDGDYTDEKFKEAYNANLANGIGNLTSRILKMSEDHLGQANNNFDEIEIDSEYVKAFNNFNIQKACDIVWQKIGIIDGLIQEKEPFKVIKEDKEKGIEIISDLIEKLKEVSVLLNPLLPETAEKIKTAILENKKPESLFLRK